QLGDVGRDPPRLVPRHQVRRRSPARLILEIDVGQRVAVGISHDEAILAELRFGVIDRPGRRESTLRHPVSFSWLRSRSRLARRSDCSRSNPPSKYLAWVAPRGSLS